MRKQIEHLLLTILTGTTVLLALTFWLNTNFGFNLFDFQHWQELALLQANGAPIDKNFYISIGIAIFVFIICLYIIYRPRFRKIPKLITQPNLPAISVEKTPLLPKNSPLPKQPERNTADVARPEPSITPQTQEPINNINLARPPKLHLPKNIAQIAATQYANQPRIAPMQSNKYDDELAEIFSENMFIVKKNPTISGFKPNLFAIGANEVVWIGGVDCPIEKMNTAIERLNSTFRETLEDITITINSFIIDTTNQIKSDNKIQIFHNIDELKQYISENPGDSILDENREDFDAYSEYIDTVLTLLYNA